jgi:8-oxo-dGTP pyrophosphatase MutT (NUDIX family)
MPDAATPDIVAGLMRHADACNNARLPGRRLPFCLAGTPVGWVTPELTARLAPLGVQVASTANLDDPERLPAVARALAEDGVLRHRGEAFDVRAEPSGPVLAQIDRGALPAFGIAATGVHLNGLVRRADGWWLWMARRAADKLLDPGKLDHIAAGGVSAGMGPAETLVKEAGEEAGLPPAMVAGATHQAVISYAMERPEGLRRDVLHCYDLVLPEGFTPQPLDGEVAAFELWPIARVLDTVRRTDDVKFNVNLVLIDLFLRLGLVDASSDALDGLRKALSPS